MTQKFEPPTSEQQHQDELVEALAQGNSQQAAKSLRNLKVLAAPEVGLLADLLDGDPGPKSLFPFRLQFAKRGGRGRPTDLLKKSAQNAHIRLAYEQALVKFGKREAALAHVEATAKIGRSTILRALVATKK